MSFSPKKHKSIVENKEERASPCKITKFSTHATETNTIWINPNTQINDALGTTVHFSKEESCTSAPIAPMCQTRDLDDMQVNQSLSIRGYIVFGDHQPEQIPSRHDLIKREGCLVDELGHVPLTLWNDHINSVTPVYYEINNLRLRKYFGKKYLSTSPEAVFTNISEDPPSCITAESVRAALNFLRLEEVKCDGKIIGADVHVYYSCVSCAKKVLYQQEPMLRCGNCQVRFLARKATKTTALRLNIKDDEGPKWYTLFTSVLETILKHHNKTTGEQELLISIDDDKLCQIVLDLEGLKLKLYNDNVVTCEFD